MPTMLAGTKRRLRLFLGIVALGTGGGIVFSVVVAIAYFPKATLLGMAFAALAAAIPGIVIFGVIAGAEIFLPQTRLGLALERAPFLVAFLIKSLVYSTLIVLVVGSKLGRWLAAYLVLGPDAAQVMLQSRGFPVAVTIIVVFLVAPVAILVIQFSGLVGGRNVRDIVLGRYHRSRIEERFFLFVDIVGSTPLAERIGPASVHGFLNRVFQIASDPIDDHGGEIYQYVGDEVVITWTVAEGRAAARPLACYFAIERALAEAAGEFEREFGVVPRLRAALHAGPVITGEVGGSRRAIVFHGDVMNTTARLENATRELQRSFLVSEDALSRVEGKEAYTMADLGLQALRGRSVPVRVYAVELGTEAMKTTAPR